MPTSLGQRYDPSWGGKPQQMATRDAIIWDRVKRELLQNARAVYFDVGVGEGLPVVTELPDFVVRSWTRISQKRIDVLIQKERSVWIVELRHAATANAIGRLLMYDMLYMDDPILGGDRFLVLVTDRRDEDVARLADKNIIKYVTVGD